MSGSSPEEKAEKASHKPEIEYDVFLSYNRQDAALVEQLAARMSEEAGLRVWLDRVKLHPGVGWRDEIERDMQQCAAALIVWGPEGLGLVQREERGLAYAIRDARQDADNEFLVLYVLLPGTPPPQGTWANVDTWVRFESSLDEPDGFATLVAAVKGEALPGAPTAELPDQPAPYRGMADFRVEDTRFFHGRTHYIREIQERLRQYPFLAVLGPSGSGKTSLVQAGFLAGLKAGDTPDSTECLSQLIRPGPDPLRSLATAIARLQPGTDLLTAADALYGRLRETPGDLPSIAQALLAPGARLILTVDRLEELFTLRHQNSKSERRAFLNALLALIGHPHHPAWVLATMRADFYGHIAHYPDLADQVVNHQLYLRSMDEKEVAEAIEKPAVEVGAYFEKGLAAQLRSDAEVRGEVALPLLQHSLDLLWRKRHGRWMTWDAYREIGGVEGALRYHADRVIEALSPEENNAARRLFARLVWLEEGAGALLAGRRAEKKSLVEQCSNPDLAERVIQGLADKRLIVLRDTGEQATAELIHDTLPLHWGRLRQWVQEDREFLLWRQRLQSALTEYVHNNFDIGALLQGTPLREAENWLKRKAEELSPEEKDFIKRGVARRRSRKRRFITGVVAVFLAISGFAVTAFWQLLDTEYQRQVARVGRLVAQAELVRNRAPNMLPHSVLLAVESMNPEGGIDTSWVRPLALRPIRTLGRLLHGRVRLVEAAEALRAGLKLMPRPIARMHEGQWVKRIAFSPDGIFLVSVSGKDVCIWRTEGSGKVRCLSHTAKVGPIAFNPDGTHLATTNKKNVYLWDMATHEQKMLSTLGARVAAIAYAPDGKFLATADGKTVRIWRVVDADEARMPLVHEKRVRAVAYSPDGTHLAAVSENSVHLWNVLDGREVIIPPPSHEGRVNAVVFSPDGRYLATGSNDHTARIWELDIHQETATEVVRVKHGIDRGVSSIAPGLVGRSTGDVLAVDFSPNSEYFATASDDNTARIWLRRGGKEIVRIVDEGGLHAVAFSPDGSLLATAGAGGSAFWEVSRGGETARMVHRNSVTGLSFSPDGAYLATTTQGDHVVHLWDLEASETDPIAINHDAAIYIMAFAQDAASLTTLSGGHVRVWKTGESDQAVTSKQQVGYATPIVGVSSNGTYLATAGDEFSIQVRRTSGEAEGPPLKHDSKVTALAFAHDGKRLATVTEDPINNRYFNVQVWDITSGEKILRMSTEDLHSTNAILFSSDDTQLAAASFDLSARVWDTVSGEEIAHLRHGAGVTAIAFSPSGKYLATASGTFARVWEIGKQQEVSRIRHENGVNAVAFHPSDDRYLATGCTDQVARVLLWRPEDLIDDACGRLSANFTESEWEHYLRNEPYRKICPNLSLSQ